MTPTERRNLLQYTFFRDRRTILALDELLRWLHYYDSGSTIPEDEREWREVAIGLVSLLGLQRDEATLDNLQNQINVAIRLQAAEGKKDGEG